MNPFSSFSGMGRYMALGIQMVAITAAGAGAGWWLDSRLGTAPWLLAVFFLIGSVAGFLAVYRGLGDGKTGKK